MRDHLERVERHNGDVLDRAAALMLDRIASGGLIYLGGSGHSLAMMLEGFFRAGGLACTYPLYEPELLALRGADAATRAERRGGLATAVLAEADPEADGLGVVFSNSGANPYPVELASGMRARGLPVVAMLSRPSMAAAPARTPENLGEVADLVIDTLVPVGDVGYPLGAPRTAATSSLTCVYLWNLLLGRMIETAGDALPLWVSANIPGGDERNAALRDRYRGRIPQL